MRYHFGNFCLLATLLLSVLHLSAAGRQKDSTQWENEIRAFEAGDRTNPPPKGATLFVGSSSIRFWTNLAECFPKRTTVRRGFGGSHLNDSTAFADRIVIPYQPANIVLYAGENDIARGDSPQEVLENFRAFVQKIHGSLPKTHVYFLSIKPAPSRWYLSPQEKEANQLIRRECRFNPRLSFIDLWPTLLDKSGQPDLSLFQPDKLHVTQKAYKLWAEIISKALRD